MRDDLTLNEDDDRDAALDPCPRRTRGGLLCAKSRYHIGRCTSRIGEREIFHEYADRLRALASTMTRRQLGDAIEFHRFAARVLYGELNQR